MNTFIGKRFPGLSKYALLIAETCPVQFDMLLDALGRGLPMPKIEQALAAIEPHVWREWVVVVLAQWGRDAAQVAPFAKDHMRQVLWNTFSTAFEGGDLKTAVVSLDRLCKLDGLYEAQKIEAIVNDAQSVADAKARLVELLQNPRVQSSLNPTLRN